MDDETDAILAALRALAQFCIEQGYDSFAWILRNGPTDPDGGVSCWRVRIEPVLAKSEAQANA